MLKLFKRLASFMILCAILLSPSAFAFGGKKQPIINPQDKIDYVNMLWWSNFSDPLLNEYIIKAITSNHDARKASWQVEEHKQFVKYQFGQELPSLSMSGNYTGVHIPDGVAKDFNKNIFTVPFIARYEGDIFLKNRDKTKAKKKAYEASKFQEKSVYISLASDVATVYLNIVKFDELVFLQEDIVRTQKEILRRETDRYKSGVSTAQNVNNYKKDYETAKNTLKDYIKSRDTLLTQLAVLTGDSAENICSLKRTALKEINYKACIPTEISSDVVFSRPDILEAEANLQKAKIDVRVARKDFLPTIYINGFYALSNLGGGNFFSWESAIAAIMAGVTQDLFKGGMKVANLKIYKARYEQIFEAYKQTDLNALKEVKDSLIIIREDTAADKNTILQSTIQLDNVNRACESAKRGVVPVQKVLAEKEQLLIAIKNRASTKTKRLIDYITLYKAVGGKL